jgi:superfamily II DNA or RNA helicase
MKDKEIKILDPIHCEVDPKLIKFIQPHLSYTKVYYKQVGPYKKIRKEYKANSILKTKNSAFVYTGFLNRIKELIPDAQVTGENLYSYYKIRPLSISGLILRNDQEKLRVQAAKAKRGLIQAPTGSGKTILGMSLYASFPEDISLLWLCHTKDLMNQTYAEFKKYGFKSVGRLGDVFKETNHQITIATRQSFKPIAAKYGDMYDMVIVDEAHHVTNTEGEYGKILTNCLAPLRYGLTATLPTSEEAKLACEGLLGPVVASLSINEAAKLNISAKPTIKLIKVVKDHSISELRKYSDVYQYGVVENANKNLIIVETAKNYIDKGHSVLILLQRIDHCKLIKEVGNTIGLDVKVVQGSVESETRTEIKKALNAKQIKCVACTAVWREGVNIPELNVVINAAGGKSEIMTLQAIGRGLRKTENKSDLTIVDIFDPSHRFLIEHFGERLCLYMDNNWI